MKEKQTMDCMKSKENASLSSASFQEQEIETSGVECSIVQRGVVVVDVV